MYGKAKLLQINHNVILSRGKNRKEKSDSHSAFLLPFTTFLKQRRQRQSNKEVCKDKAVVAATPLVQHGSFSWKASPSGAVGGEG